MTELYLIAHKVRGGPAFDVAERMECPECQLVSDIPSAICAECDNTGYWWIIPTSGHRAYPYWDAHLEGWTHQHMHEWGVPEMPADLPDHYPPRSEPSRMQALLALIPKKVERPFKRRF